MKIFYINLDRETARREVTEQELAGLDFARSPAVDGRQNPPRFKDLNRFQIACIDSHRVVWRSFLESGEAFCCILEDDLHFSPDFRAFLQDTNWIPEGADAVKLDTFYNVVMIGAARPGPAGRGVAPLFTRHESSAAYIVSRKGAETFLRLTENPKKPVDYILFPRDPVGEGLSVWQVAPAPAIQDSRYEEFFAPGHKFVSGIARIDDPKPKEFWPKLAFVIKREGLRLLRDVERFRVYLVNRLIRRLTPKIIPFE